MRWACSRADRGHGHVDRHLVTHRRGPAVPGRFQGAGQPAGAFARPVLRERGELRPSGGALDQRPFPDRDAAEAGAHRDRERAQSRQRRRGPVAQFRARTLPVGHVKDPPASSLICPDNLTTMTSRPLHAVLLPAAEGAGRLMEALSGPWTGPGRPSCPSIPGCPPSGLRPCSRRSAPPPWKPSKAPNGWPGSLSRAGPGDRGRDRHLRVHRPAERRRAERGGAHPFGAGQPGPDRRPALARPGCPACRRVTSRVCRCSCARCCPASAPVVCERLDATAAAALGAQYVSLVPTQVRHLLDEPGGRDVLAGFPRDPARRGRGAGRAARRGGRGGGPGDHYLRDVRDVRGLRLRRGTAGRGVGPDRPRRPDRAGRAGAVLRATGGGPTSPRPPWTAAGSSRPTWARWTRRGGWRSGAAPTA